MLTHKATLAMRQVVSVFLQHGQDNWNVAVNIAQRANHPTSTILPIDGRIKAMVGKALSAASTSRTNVYDKPTN